jgi:hypothetical protein
MEDTGMAAIDMVLVQSLTSCDLSSMRKQKPIHHSYYEDNLELHKFVKRRKEISE